MPSKSSAKMAPYNAEHEKLFKDVVYIVESTYNERHLFWEKFHYKPFYDDFKIESWEVEMSGTGTTIGTVDGRPVTLDITWAKLEGYRVLFYDVMSEVADWKMVEKWFSHWRKQFPQIQSTDSTNVGHCVRYCIDRAKKNKENKNGTHQKEAGKDQG